MALRNQFTFINSILEQISDHCPFVAIVELLEGLQPCGLLYGIQEEDLADSNCSDLRFILLSKWASKSRLQEL